MFLCLKCHIESRCKSRDFEEMTSTISRGKCEGCHRQADCIDCHSTDRPDSKEDEEQRVSQIAKEQP